MRKLTVHLAHSMESKEKKSSKTVCFARLAPSRMNMEKKDAKFVDNMQIPMKVWTFVNALVPTELTQLRMLLAVARVALTTWMRKNNLRVTLVT